MSVWSALELGKLRTWIQIGFTALTNGYAAGFLKGKIYTGDFKKYCVPGLNCYSCPGALGSCPIGSLQAVIGSRNMNFSFYVVGFLMLTGAVFGRFVCGWLCPFGLIQDLLYKIPFVRKWKRLPGERGLRLLRYAILIGFVVLLPMFAVDIIGQGSPWFCKYICPLGAVYSLFQPISVFRYRVDQEACTHCGACAKICKMQVDPSKSPNHMECIRCGQCIKVCPTSAITSNIRRNKKQ